MRKIGRFVRSATRFADAWLIASLLIAGGLPAFAAGETRNVLVLYSNGRLLPANIQGDRGLRETISTTADRPVIVFDEFLDTPRFSGQTYVQTFVTYLREKYSFHPVDVVVVAGGDALRFLLDNRAELFPRVPVIHMGVSQALLQSISPLPAGVVGVPVQYNFSDTIDQALRWHPQVRHLVIVTGAAVQDRKWEAQLRADVSRFKDRATAEFLTGLTTNAVQNRLRELGSDAVVFTPGYFQDGAGRYVTPRESIELMAAVATAPIYGPFDTFMGTGIVGGWMPNFEAMGRQTGQTVNALLEGSVPAATRLPETMPNTLNVDSRQMRRWGIDENAIPADAVVHFKTPTFLEAYRNEASIAAAVILLQAGLIVWLLVERYRRRLAEQSVQKQRSELAHASRLAMPGELTGSIAHEINQPLGAILSNADAADLLLESGTDRRDELRGILAEIRRDDLRASEVIRRLRALLANQEVEKRLSMREALKRLLNAAGFACAAYASGEQLLTRGGSEGAACVVSDLNLPAMSGFELLTELHARGWWPPLILITAHDAPGLREEAARRGAAAYLAKPFPGTELLDAIKAVIEHERLSRM